MKLTCIKRYHRQIFSRGVNILLVLLTVALVLTGCSPAEQIPTDPECIFDDCDPPRLICFNETPENIISLAPSNTEILFALGLGDKVVGVTDSCDYPPEALEKEKVGGPWTPPDLETILRLEPDLILASDTNPFDTITALEGLALTVFGIKSIDLDDVLNDIRTIGEITDKEIEAQLLTSEMAVGIQAVTNVTSGLDERPRVFYLMDTWGGLWTVGQGTFMHELIVKGGGVNICGNITGYTIISLAEVLARNPEVIITSSWPGVYEWVMNETSLNSTAARQNNRVFVCDDNLAQRPGPRIVKGLEWFAHFIHPEIFDEPED